MQDKTSKQTSDHQKNQSGRSKRSLHESEEEPRDERDVIRLRNPTEDKRAFRQMLTSADQTGEFTGERVRVSGRKNVMSMRELFCPDPLAGSEKMAGFQIFFCLKI